MTRLISIIAFIIPALAHAGPTGMIKGYVQSSGKPVANAEITLDGTDYYTTSSKDGSFSLGNIPEGTYVIYTTAKGYNESIVHIELRDTMEFYIHLDSSKHRLGELLIKDDRHVVEKMRNVEGFGIFAGKKTEVINLEKTIGNLATNNSRQVYARIAGLNIWESDAAGLQLGIGGRGLNPNRVSNFNTRQNGYDISADALGYPESYYTPVLEGVERIEIIRGAASLQYGSQFGGVINFRMKQPESKPMVWQSRYTAGSFGFLSSYQSLSGTKGKFSYHSFYQFKRGDGWRPNSHFDAHNAFLHLGYQLSNRLKLSGEYTFMNYLAQQPGGLTDAMFQKDPSQSVRARNFFRVNWNLLSLNADYEIRTNLSLNTKFFGLLASREALGVLSFIHRADPMKNRDLWTDKFRNFGNETRLLYRYKIKSKISSLVIGSRIYSGHTARVQGLGNSKSTGGRSDFKFNSPEDPEYSSYVFPGFNTALFAENIIPLGNRLSLVPGLRYEYINTRAKGAYNVVNYDLAGNIIYKQRFEEVMERPRSIFLAGLGLTWTPRSCMDVYANFSQNYRSINFNDIRVANPNLVVDPKMQDEKGYSADMGMRGSCKYWFNYDISVFMIRYNNRIGAVLMADTTTMNTYRFRTNISDSRNLGIESYAEIDLLTFSKS